VTSTGGRGSYDNDWKWICNRYHEDVYLRSDILCRYDVCIIINRSTTTGTLRGVCMPVNQYIITEEQLYLLDKMTYIPPIVRPVLKEVRSHPYQSERDKVLDKLIKAIDRQRVAVGANPSKVEGLSLAIDIVESFRQQAGEWG
jgi:hypothetical protein